MTKELDNQWHGQRRRWQDEEIEALQADLKALAMAAQSCVETNDMEYLWEALDRPGVKALLDAKPEGEG